MALMLRSSTVLMKLRCLPLPLARYYRGPAREARDSPTLMSLGFAQKREIQDKRDKQKREFQEERDKQKREFQEERDKQKREFQEERERLLIHYTETSNKERSEFWQVLCTKAKEREELGVTVAKERAELVAMVDHLTGERTKLQIVASNLLHEKLRLQGNLNVRGAMETIANSAVDLGHIKSVPGIDKRLINLSKTEEYQHIMKAEAIARNICPKEVEGFIPNLYHELCKQAHGNDRSIVVRAGTFTVGERAAIISFLKLQDKWTTPMRWSEELCCMPV